MWETEVGYQCFDPSHDQVVISLVDKRCHSLSERGWVGIDNNVSVENNVGRTLVQDLPRRIVNTTRNGIFFLFKFIYLRG